MSRTQLRFDDQHRTPTDRPVPLLDVNRENAGLRDEMTAALQQVTDSGRFILGPDCETLEQRIAQYTQVPHAIGCASGSDALLLALMAIDLQPGDEVILPSFTFFATASAVWRLGATPVFVDIEPATFNMNPQAVAEAVTPRSKAVIPVHLFGQAVDMGQLMQVARQHDLLVIEDAAQAIGAAWNNSPVGSIGDIGCFSFYPTKNLGGFGDGGMLTTKDAQLAQRLRLLRGHGMQPRYHHREVGINSRLDSIQAAILNVKLSHLPQWTVARQANAARYAKLFDRSLHAGKLLGLPQSQDQALHVWNQYTVRVPDGRRDALRQHLADYDIGSEIYYPIPLHQQACFQSLGPARHSLAETERAAGEVLSLPIFPMLEPAEQLAVVRRIDEFFSRSSQMTAPGITFDAPNLGRHPGSVAREK